MAVDSDANYNTLSSEEEGLALQDKQNQEQEPISRTFVYSKLDQLDVESSRPTAATCSLPQSSWFNKLLTLKSHFSTKGWRGVLIATSCATLAIILINFILLAWATRQPTNNGNYILFQGDCDKTKAIDVWVHLAINIMSTVVLAASNYSMQILIAPTRSLIDLTHVNDRYLDVGISSIRNLIAVPRKQKLLWALLLVGSLPLHLFWNSIIISTSQSVGYDVLLVTQDYTQGVIPKNIYNSYLGLNITDWKNSKYGQLQSQVNTTMQHLSNADCISTVAPIFVQNIANLILVSNITSDANGLVLNDFPTAVDDIRDTWQCEKPLGDSIYLQEDCLTETPDPQDWSFFYCSYPQNSSQTQFPCQLAEIEYCLADTIPDACTVELLPTLLGIVLLCNLLKLISFLAVLYLDLHPLLTLGDAIASFLDSPESLNNDIAVTAGSVRTSLRRRKIFRQARFYLSSASRRRLISTISGLVAYWLVGLALFLFLQLYMQSSSLSQAWAIGITSMQPGSIWTLPPNYSIFTRVLLANIPQVLLSIAYFSYNAIFTSIMIAREWVAYAQSCKGLRTHQPEGQQRSTHFLSLPYRYSVPTIVAWSLLHWFLSLSFFATQIQIYNSDHSISSENINGVGWSTISLLLVLILGGLTIIGLVMLSFRRYPKTVPMVSSNSLAISANCWPVNRGKREAIQKLQYGVVEDGDIWRYTFSSGVVQPLVYDQESWPRRLWKVKIADDLEMPFLPRVRGRLGNH